MVTAIISCNYTIQGLYNLKHLLLFSTNSPNQSTKLRFQSSKSPIQSYTNYLVNNLGFSPQQALPSSNQVSSDVSIFKSSSNAGSVVAFLKQHGFNSFYIRKLVSSRPEILASNVDETLIPKFQVLQDHGFSGSDLVSVISTNPSFLFRDMNPIILNLKAVLGSHENLTRVFRRSRSLTSTSSLENLVSNVALLNNEYGIDIHVIRNSILHHHAFYTREPEFFQNALVRVVEELGIPPTYGTFLHGLHLVCYCSKETIDSKREVFKSFGWTDYDVSELIRRHPHALRVSEGKIRKKLGFLMTELGYKPEYLARHAALMSYSLDKRLRPRHRVLLVLKEKGLLLDFYSAAIRTEKQFLKLYIEPFKEDGPGLLELYESSKGC